MMEDGDDQPRAARAGRRARAAAAQQDSMGEGPSYSGGDQEAFGGGGGAQQAFGGSYDAPAPAPRSPGQDDAGGRGFDEEPAPRQSVGLRAPPAQQREEEPQRSPAGPPVPRRGGFADGAFDGGPSSAPPADPLAGDPSKRYDGVSRRKQQQVAREDEEKQRVRGKYDELAVEAVLEIPELEEEGKEDLSRVVAAAPKVRTNKVQGMTELDEDMQYRLPNTDDRDIDLSLLTTVLCSSEQVVEDDDLWEPDMLFTNVASELNLEKEKADGVTPEVDDKPLDAPL